MNRLRVDRRVCRVVVLATWCSFFAWLWLGGEMTRYLGPRTRWVVVFGALSLLAATVVVALEARRARNLAVPATTGEAVSMALLLVPLLVLALVPRPSLGALAAARKSTATEAIALGSLAVPVPEPGREVSFIDLHYANRSSDYARMAGIVEGTPVRLLGFVTRSAGSHETGLELTRFYISCCAADAIPYSALIQRPSSEGGALSGLRSVAEDTWLGISGHVSLVDERLVVVPERVSVRKEPIDPYLY